MKRSRLALLPAFAASLLLSGCYVNLASPTPNLTVKLDADSAPKSGEATCTGFLWAFATGDCSVDTAMKRGKISKVHHVDGKTKVILWGAYSEGTVVVHGE
ncbi:MAG: TRL domain-containing protein [Pseudomonadota bacterium]